MSQLSDLDFTRQEFLTEGLRQALFSALPPGYSLSWSSETRECFKIHSRRTLPDGDLIDIWFCEENRPLYFNGPLYFAFHRAGVIPSEVTNQRTYGLLYDMAISYDYLVNEAFPLCPSTTHRPVYNFVRAFLRAMSPEVGLAFHQSGYWSIVLPDWTPKEIADEILSFESKLVQVVEAFPAYLEENRASLEKLCRESSP